MSGHFHFDCATSVVYAKLLVMRSGFYKWADGGGRHPYTSPFGCVRARY